MNGFFGVGPLELLVIGVLALIFIGPQRLPGVIGQVMRTLRELRAYASQVQEELRAEFEPIQKDLEGVAADLTQAATEISRDVNEIALETQHVAESAVALPPSSPSTAFSYTPGTGVAVPEYLAPLPPRATLAPLPAPTGTHNNGVAHDEEESRPRFADYRPE